MRTFIASPGTGEQLLRDLCDHVGFPVPTALRVEAERADVRDEIDRARETGDVERADLLERSNTDLLNEDRETVLTERLADLKDRAEKGDTSAANEAVQVKAELAEVQARNVDESVDVPEEPATDDTGKEGDKS